MFSRQHFCKNRYGIGDLIKFQWHYYARRLLHMQTINKYAFDMIPIILFMQ